MLVRILAASLLAAFLASPALAVTARDLSARIRIDGFTNDFTEDESVFGVNAEASALEEATDDSRWGVNNDINQIRITWDAENLYLAGEGRTWNNNMVILIDAVPERGLESMTALNSWRRNFVFDTTGAASGLGFAPDFFAATWDGNATPRLIVQLNGNQVDDEISGQYFTSAATLLQGNTGRAMELAIPWSSVFLVQAGLGTRDTTIFLGGEEQRIRRFPPGAKLRICGVVTAGGDGTGGPDSAPDNLRGHTDNSGDQVFIDNWAIVEIDRNDDTGLGAGQPDGVADWGVAPRSRVSFRYRPPVVALRFALTDVTLDRPAFAPDRGERLRFRMAFEPPLDSANPVDQQRKVNLTANVFDLRGRFVRNLYISQQRFALDAASTDFDTWDGRDERGERVPPGVYVLRTVIEPNLSRATRSFVVVR